MKLIVGLGNPGKEYEKTRHNVGFLILDNYLGDVKWSSKYNGLYFETNINGEKYIFLKPQSFMNLSGSVVLSFVNYFDINIHDIIIIHDDLDLPTGTLRIKTNSSAGGHNGIKDIINALHTNEFIRIKIGISQNKLIPTKDYVLGNFSKSDLHEVLNNSSIIADIIENFSYENINIFMNKYN